ncbi:MAG TPA: hypothetical protein VFU03_02575 [Gemmatimonadales bacterium]|nr:hypothetical protein [Gemmatimonadales bacterium]
MTISAHPFELICGCGTCLAASVYAGSARGTPAPSVKRHYGVSVDAVAVNSALWIKEHRNKKRTRALWLEAAAKLRGHFDYFGVSYNQPKLAQYYYTSIKSLFRWLNRRSQKRSFTWVQFSRKLWFNPLPKPPSGDELIDITSEHHTERNHQPKSRMREIRTSGSVRGASRLWRLAPT